MIVMVLENPNYRDKARWFQKVLGETRGLDVAADIIERVFCTTSRVYLASIEAILVELTVAIRFLHRRDAGFSSVSFLWHQRVNPYGDPRRIFYCHF
jgi:hypothetical protein